jgi:hypothetical protein
MTVITEALLAKIPALSKLAEKLLLERERGREKFVDQVVEPLNTVFIQLTTEHMATFRKLDAILNEEDFHHSQLLEILDQNILFESGTVNLLRELTRSRVLSKVPQSNLQESFETYIRELASCLIVGAGDLPQMSVTYYASLSDIFRNDSRGHDQASLLAELRKVISRFTVYQAQVTRAYLELKRVCLQ